MALTAAIHNRGHLPRHSGIARIVNSHHTVGSIRIIDEHSLRRLRNSRNDSSRTRAAPRKTSKAKPNERMVSCRAVVGVLNQSPRQPTISRAQQPTAIKGVRRIIGIARPCKHNPRLNTYRAAFRAPGGSCTLVYGFADRRFDGFTLRVFL